MKIIYIMDPHCKWCYATSDAILQLYNTLEGKLPFEVIPAGMLAGEFSQTQSPVYAFAHRKLDASITKETGIVFGEGYKNALEEKEMVLDSLVPSRAIMACQATVPQLTLQFTHNILHARFHEGKDLNEQTVYLEICEQLGINKQLFFQHFSSIENDENTRQAFLYAEKYAEHYPTLFFEEDGEMELLTEGYAPYSLLELRLSKLLRRSRKE